jgi:hypothetical protein
MYGEREIQKGDRGEALVSHCSLSRPGTPTAPGRRRRSQRRRSLRSSPPPSRPSNPRRITGPDHGMAAGELPPVRRPPMAPSAPNAVPPPPRRRRCRKPRPDTPRERGRESRWRGVSSWGRVVITGSAPLSFAQTPLDLRVFTSEQSLELRFLCLCLSSFSPF